MTRRSRRMVAPGALLAMAAVLAACWSPPGSSQGEGERADLGGDLTVLGPTPDEDGLVIASSFEGKVCGFYGRPPPGCEFGTQGPVETVPFGARTGKQALQIDHASGDVHMGVIALVSLRDGHAFFGVAHKVPELLPELLDPREPYLELSQMSPTDGVLHGWPVEVRIYADRTLALALFQSRDEVRTTWKVPVDTWFYVVVEMTHGDDALQQMWVYDDHDREVDHVSIRGDTNVDWVHEIRMGQKVGGSSPTPESFVTYADDWYIAYENRGPLHISASGAPV